MGLVPLPSGFADSIKPTQRQLVCDFGVRHAPPMATLTMSSVRPQLGTTAQYISSPLAGPSHNSATTPPRPLPRRNPQFTHSRPIRPFASVSQSATTKPVKLIEPPQNFKTTFILDLTQGELGRQD